MAFSASAPALPPIASSHNRVEGRVEQALHEAVRRVVAAGGLAFVAGELGEGKPRAVGADLRSQCEEAFVNAAKLFRTEVLVVHRAQDFALAGEGQVSEGFEKVGIGEFSAAVRGQAGSVQRTVEDGSQSRLPRAGSARFCRAAASVYRRECADQQLELPPEITNGGCP